MSCWKRTAQTILFRFILFCSLEKRNHLFLTELTSFWFIAICYIIFTSGQTSFTRKNNTQIHKDLHLVMSLISSTKYDAMPIFFLQIKRKKKTKFSWPLPDSSLNKIHKKIRISLFWGKSIFLSLFLLFSFTFVAFSENTFELFIIFKRYNIIKIY